MKTMSKAIVGTIAACAMALPAVTPALAHDGGRDGRDYGRDGFDYARAGYSDRGYDTESGYGFRDDRTNPREAVERCIRAAQFTASRNGYTAARVTEIRNVERNDRGFTIKASMAVGRDWQRGYGDYGRGWNNSYRDQNNGWVRCKVAYGRVVDLDFGGIRGL